MHPFQRLSHHISHSKSHPKHARDYRNGVEYCDREDDSDECKPRDKSRKTSPNRKKELLDARYAETLQRYVAVTPVEKQPYRTDNALKAKETALRSNNSKKWDSNAERLGSNKNNIIKESLMSEKR